MLGTQLGRRQRNSGGNSKKNGICCVDMFLPRVFSTGHGSVAPSHWVALSAFADWADYNVMEDGQVVGRIYEDRQTPAEYRCFWSITAFHVDPRFGITTNDRVPTLEEVDQRSGRGDDCCHGRAAERARFWHWAQADMVELKSAHARGSLLD
jgi:hypothetical protein